MRRDLLLLREMRDAAVRIRDLVGDRSPELLEADMLRRSALLWHFTVLGEAASQVSAEMKDSRPEISWGAATRLRNRIVHGYWDVDMETLFATAADDLPHMIAKLESVIATVREAEDLETPD